MSVCLNGGKTLDQFHRDRGTVKYARKKKVGEGELNRALHNALAKKMTKIP